MRYGVLADVHGNLRAFRTAVATLQQAGMEKLLFLGDLVGYCAEPGECIDLIRSLAASMPVAAIAGNHDRNVLGEPDPNMRTTAKRTIKWTQDVLQPHHLDYLRSLPQGQVVDGTILMVHGSLVTRDAYILSTREVEANRKCMAEEFPGLRICFFAHTHVPMLIGSQVLMKDLKESRAFKLDPADTFLVNPGSVGQPRDRSAQAAFGLYDSEARSMFFYRRPYDVAGARAAIIAAGLPEKFARRLELGV